jgi:hypothetical protein
VRILGLVTKNGHSSTHADCIKRGSGWHPFRDLPASSSDHISSSPPFECPTSKISPFLGALLYPSSFCLPSCLINACLVWCQPSCMNFGAIFHPVLEFFWTLFGLCLQYSQSTVLYCTVCFFFPLQPLLLLSQQSHASSVVVLITATLCTFFCLRLPVVI